MSVSRGLQDLTKRTGGIKDESIIAWITLQICAYTIESTRFLINEEV